jgi:hypothetical protein
MIKVYFRKPDNTLGTFEGDYPDSEVETVRQEAIELIDEAGLEPVTVLALLQGGK